MIPKNFFNIFFLCYSILLVACSSGEDNSERKDALQKLSNESFKLNKEQVVLAAIKTGELEYKFISPTVSCTGEIDIPPQSKASVSAPLGGYIQRSPVVVGSYVERGQTLAILTNPEYITLQQEYLGTLSELNFAEKDYERQRILSKENATAEKKLQQSQSAYQFLKGKLAGLKAQLQLIGIGISKLEEGNIQSTVNLRAPISGYVTEINHHLGQFAEGREVIFEVMNQDNLHLELNVFEQDISKIAIGQSLTFKPVGGDKIYRGEVSTISPKRNSEERTFTIHAHFDHGDNDLKPGMFVEAEIMLSNENIPALPEKAIIYSGDRHFVVTEDDEGYKILNVEAGQKSDGWVEIKNTEQLNDKKIVTEGASRIFAALQRE